MKVCERLYFTLLSLWSLTTVTGSFEKSWKRFRMGRMVGPKFDTIEHVFHKYAIATDSPICSKIGKEMLEKGLTAVDAAITALFCLSVVHPHSSGIGGGGFMLVYMHSNKSSEFIDFRETGPGCSNADMAEHNHLSVSRGGLAVAVPGELKGYDYAWKKYGKASWKTLLHPAIELLESGVAVDESLSIAIQTWQKEILQEQSLRKTYTRAGKILQKGDRYNNKRLKNTFERISKHGPNLFYDNFSKVIEKEVNDKGGCLKRTDLLSYKVSHQKPTKLKFGSTTLLLSPPPTSGPILGLILNVFKGFNFTGSDLAKDPVKVYHCLIETLKFAFGQRIKLSDPNFDKTEAQFLKHILSDEFANQIRSKISQNSTHNMSYYGSVRCNSVKTGTTHLVAIDRYKNMVSVTSTINGYFGAKFASKEYGFVYNNEIDDFCFPDMENDYLLPPSTENFPKPGKRPVSSSVPTILLDDQGEPLIAIGGSGGSIITTATAQVLINHMIFGQSLKKAIDRPRLHAQLTPNKVYFESRFNQKIIDGLKKLGHEANIGDVNHGVVQALARLAEGDEWLTHSFKKQVVHSRHMKIFAEADYRKGGVAFGS